ncbi:DNA polymerase III subunit gamma/tau [Colwellia piezophila]|uniref:DNA polymerase III subunit gamma/tau n=1 Tax=Colwellia piezophila TaxID=211668 RepID=UPI00037F0D6E|nr:DNA polymerase III subunit gamma/tau [Colwellia piezophila]
MSYQVLARKWRPKNFQQLMGQEHVVNVLANALSQKRLHHAYLFTGTRGVGKTTIARIFAKSLNCDIGITDTPCGICDACIDIDQGRFVDLLEIDAASKTKVDDTREILDNVQYAPSRGRFKVYLIDEVHMLSRHSFNALLKTLEEPPEHVKFILATTDPQKLPITVLSRCLQFHLKALTVKQIEEKLAEILLHEKVTYEQGCLTLLAKAARGSMRDSLSLTDQAIAQGQGNISLANIQQMLGGIDQNWVYKVVIALLKQDSQGLMALSQEIASYAPSYSRLFAELIQLFHQIALIQIVDQHFDLPADLLVLLKKFSQAMSAEDVQLYYQISLNGRKDLPYTFDEQAAFDMTLLRLLAFKPMIKSQLAQQSTPNQGQLISDTNFDEVKFSTTAVSDDSALVAQSTSVSSVQVELTESDTFKIDSDTEKGPNVIEPKALVEHHLVDDDLVNKNIDEQAEPNELSVLNEEMRSIEQHAVELKTADNSLIHSTPIEPDVAQEPTPATIISKSIAQTPAQVLVAPEKQDNNEQQQPAPVISNPPLVTNEPVNSLSINSPVASVLATRNMLRSRKKELEKQAKKPGDAALRHPSNEGSKKISTIETSAKGSHSVVAEKLVIAPEPEVPFHQDNIDPAKVKKANQVDKWAHMIDSMQLTARIRQLAIHATISEDSTDDNLILKLDQATRHLSTEVAHQQLQRYISDFLGRDITVTLDIVDETVADPYQIQVQINDKRLEYAKALLKEDAVVIALQDTFQAELNEDTISPR